MKAGTDSRPRAFHAYCVGDAKSGTSSLAGMFQTNFRSAHEPERGGLLDIVVAFDNQQISRGQLDAYLRDRDERLQIELDSAWANYFVMDQLAVLFPDAKFVQLVRDCYTWVESVVNHLIRGIPPDVQGFMDWWFEPWNFSYGSGDRELKEAGLYPLACYLARWSKQAAGPAKVIPADRLLTIRTHEISDSIEDIARFLGVSPDLIDESRSHRNAGSRERPLLTLVEKSYLEETVARVCKDSMERYFPDVRSVEDAFALRSYPPESQ